MFCVREPRAGSRYYPAPRWSAAPLVYDDRIAHRQLGGEREGPAEATTMLVRRRTSRQWMGTPGSLATACRTSRAERAFSGKCGHATASLAGMRVLGTRRPICFSRIRGVSWLAFSSVL